MAFEVESGYVDIGGLRAYRAAPRLTVGAEQASGMLVLPMVTGIGEQVRAWVDQLAAEAGCVALAWDTWHGKSSDDTPFDELRAWNEVLRDDEALDEQTRLLSYLQDELRLERVGVIGWCLGGRFALILGGRHATLANVIAFHPTVTLDAGEEVVNTVERTRQIKAPVFLAYPGKDSIVPWESFSALQTALQSRPVAASIVHLYPEAKHGFSDERRHGEEVNACAYRLSWPQTLAFVRATTVSS
ncbi:dienelactone hydrolase family protein [Nocardia jinanensis]|uniref:Carboxymethylenebutenolidase n=1 Tax=Nocardia jinanensis TaxID=382504 RepID=A0A917VT70_9NOCA|nr:dienelactone hydrolase family protein [Nocardia jinanensis]GGL11818.1 carboxymethylenebutenolidase [Nocardia jinanensis]